MYLLREMSQYYRTNSVDQHSMFYVHLKDKRDSSDNNMLDNMDKEDNKWRGKADGQGQGQRGNTYTQYAGEKT